jgi:hypothetical protein
MLSRARKLQLGIGAGVAVAGVAGGVAYWVHVPALGLDQARVVVASGEVGLSDVRALGDAHARAKDVVAPGSTLKTGRGSACVSLRSSRVCIGANAEVVVVDVPDKAGGNVTVDAKHGTLVVVSVAEPVRVTLPAGSVTVKGGTVAIEGADGGDPVVRALDGSATLEPSGQPPVVLAAPDTTGLRDSRKRAPSPEAEKEERGVATTARHWQGSAGAVVAVKGTRGRVEIDGSAAGVVPLEVLLDEGDHVLVVRDGADERIRETLHLKAGQRVERGG